MPRRIIRKNRKYGKKRVSRRVSGYNPDGDRNGYRMAGSLAKKSKVQFALRKDLTYISPKLGLTGCMPQSLFTQHRYCEEIALASDNLTGYTGSQYVFRLNSLYDPNLTGVGHQPQGYDQMAQFYNTYRVYKVDIYVRVTAISHTGLYLCTAITPFNVSYDLGLKQQSEILENTNTNAYDGFVGNVAVQNNVYIADIEGQKRQAVFDDLLFRAKTDANPANVSFFRLAMGSTDLTTGAAMRVMVGLTFHTMWSDRISLPQS